MIGPTKLSGGMSVHVRELSKGLRSKGDEISIIQKIDGDGLSAASYYCSRVLRDFDIVHVQGLQYFQPLLASLAARRLLGARILATAHGFGGESSWWRSYNQRNLMRSILRKFDALISISHYVQDRLWRFTGMQPPKIATIYNGVDTSFFDPKIDSTGFRERIGTENEFVVLYVGRLAWNKGLVDLIDSISSLVDTITNLKLIICGKGRLETELRNRVDSLNLQKHVEFVGLVPQEQLPLYYAASDVVAAPSIFEPFGLVNLEALAMSKPVVTTRVGGIPELVKNMDTGLLVHPNAPSEIGNAILELNHNEGLRKRLGENGRRLVEREFSLEKMAQDTWRYYRTVSNVS